MSRIYNFSAGPAMLPTSVLQTAQAEMLNWQATGMSVMEISHRSADFMALIQHTEQLLRELMSIPNNYQVLFLPGGARSQFAMLPMNLLLDNKKASYAVTGRWSDLAYQEAEKYGDIQLIEPEHDNTVPQINDEAVASDAAYCYYTPNETVHGIEFNYIPDVSMPLVADMTSCILSRQYDVTKFGVIFAAAQKNMGQAGITVVIIRDDLIQTPPSFVPSMFAYHKHCEHHSLYNTTPTYAVYIMNLVLKDLLQKGGVPAVENINRQKAEALYRHIDASRFYVNHIEPAVRSTMNVTFHLNQPELSEKFIAAAAEQGLVGLKGHSSVGGIRASLYNAMPLAGVHTLCDFMTTFAKEHANVAV